MVTLCGIDEQVAKAEKAVAGQVSVRNPAGLKGYRTIEIQADPRHLHPCPLPNDLRQALDAITRAS